MKEEQRKREREEEAFDSNKKNNNSVLCNGESSFTGVHYKWSNIFKSMTK